MNYRGMDKKAEIQQEIEDLYGKYRVNLHIFVSTAVKNTYAVEDIVQDVFLEALKKYDAFKNHPNQIGWLYRTAAYKIKEYERRLHAISLVDVEEELNAPEDEHGYLETEFKLLLHEELTPEEHRRYNRYFRFGYSVEEIAELEGVTVNNMRVRLSRLKKKLLKLTNIDMVFIFIVGVVFFEII